jgi:hypothetical protein
LVVLEFIYQRARTDLVQFRFVINVFEYYKSRPLACQLSHFVGTKVCFSTTCTYHDYFIVELTWSRSGIVSLYYVCACINIMDIYCKYIVISYGFPSHLPNDSIMVDAIRKQSLFFGSHSQLHHVIVHILCMAHLNR